MLKNSRQRSRISQRNPANPASHGPAKHELSDITNELVLSGQVASAINDVTGPRYQPPMAHHTTEILNSLASQLTVGSTA